MNRHVNTISARLSLRAPQRESLEILDRVTDIISLEKNSDTITALETINSEFRNVTDFERDFPSLCFELATGVGKTRLMGAFIAYLYLAKNINHFFVLAPNLTIYNKLIRDFTPGDPKYVLRGIEAFANDPPEIITGDNYESGRGVRARSLFGFSGVHINIFNISKINSEVRGGNAPRIKRLSEYIGQSYFDYLASLDDLVLLMDESHRYRAKAGLNAINELKPVIGLELTATAQIETSRGPVPFKNVIYSYPLSFALRDGFIKEPAVATRENFNPRDYTDEQLERLKLEDGVRIHESVKVDLETFARQNDKPIVKPFMLIIARDTAHAGILMQKIKDDTFFGGRYKNKVITVHSNQRGEEADETVSKLLDVEKTDEPTEIVIHVNMLKEGWDVTNLYTIVPLRAANSRTLVEQSIGRGLRLPYGKRVGVSAVDRLTIVAHDKFQEIVDEANRDDSVLKIIPVYIGRDVAQEAKVAVTVQPNFVLALNGNQSAAEKSNDNGTTVTQQSPTVQQPIIFATPYEQQVAQTTLEIIKSYERLPRSIDLQKPQVQAEIVRAVESKLIVPTQNSFEGLNEKPNLEEVVAKTTEKFVELTIDIPKIIVVPKGEMICNYKYFNLDTTNVNLQPAAMDILIQSLQTNQQERLENENGVVRENRLEDYLVRSLIDYDDISYDEHADLLYDLGRQLVEHLQSYLEPEKVEAVLQQHHKRLAELIRLQMLQHQTQEVVDYEVTVTKGFNTLRANSYSIKNGENIRNFRAPVDERQDIRKMHFGGFNRCLYPLQKFESDAERRFSIILEDDSSVLKWFKPAKNQFQIYYHHDASYEPDFVVETVNEKLLCETKRADEINDTNVLAKAKAAVEWCEHASQHEREHSGKPWRYILIPHNEVQSNKTILGLVSAFSRKF